MSAFRHDSLIYQVLTVVQLDYWSFTPKKPIYIKVLGYYVPGGWIFSWEIVGYNIYLINGAKKGWVPSIGQPFLYQFCTFTGPMLYLYYTFGLSPFR